MRVNEACEVLSRAEPVFDLMKQDSNAVFVFAILVTLVLVNLMLWGLSFEGVFPFEAADNVGVSIFVVLVWSFAWWNARRHPKPDNPSQAPR